MMPYHPQMQVWLCSMHQQEIARAVHACRGVPRADSPLATVQFEPMPRMRRWLVAWRWRFHARRQQLALRRVRPASLRRLR